MNEFDTVVLENNLEYIILNTVELNDYNYLILVNVNNYQDFAIRKDINNELVGLNDELELNNVLIAFFKKIGGI